MLSFIDRFESQPQFAERLDALKHNLLARPELGELTQHLWLNVKDCRVRGPLHQLRK